MGYYTHYDATVDATDLEPAIAAEVAKLDEFAYLKIENPKTINDVLFAQGETKWYSHMGDMAEISAKFPNVLITLWGEGENRDDMWIAYFKNGKMRKYYAEITYPDFSESELTD